jgi:vancomycin resistance protein YoaR
VLVLARARGRKPKRERGDLSSNPSLGRVEGRYLSLKNQRRRDRRARTSSDYGGLYPFDSGKQDSKRRGVAGPIIIICAIIAVLVAADFWLSSGKIHRGVEVGNVSLGGMTPAEARQTVEDHVMGPLEEIEFSGPENFSRKATDMGVSFNVARTVNQAYAVGREGNVLDRLSQRLRASFGGATIPPDIDFRPEMARAQVQEIATQVNHQPKEADVKIYGSEVEVSKSRDGYELNPAATMTSIDGAIDDMSGKVSLEGEVLEPAVTTPEAETAAKKARGALSEPLEIKAQNGESWTIQPDKLGPALEVTKQNGNIDVGLNPDRMDGALTSVYDGLTIKTVDASYGFDSDGDVIVKPAHFGRKVESEKLIDDIEGGIFEGKREYQVSTTVDKPEHTTAGLQAKKPTELLGSYHTNYTATSDKTQARVNNLNTASHAISGTFLAPGETFSMNDTVSGLDYESGHVIVDGATSNALGGGLCQVTSTLYNAALYAGLDIVERNPHATQLPYIRPGMDATVWFGDQYGNNELDMKFKNTTDGYILLQEYVADDNYIYAQVYGVPDNVQVRMSSEPVYTGSSASEWTTYYTKRENGKVVDREHWNTSYEALYEEGKPIPTSIVPVAEVNGDYFGHAIPAAE